MSDEKCWCGHVKAHHSEWAAGVFCMNVKCDCRHYGRAGTQLAKVRELKSARANGTEADLKRQRDWDRFIDSIEGKWSDAL